MRARASRAPPLHKQSRARRMRPQASVNHHHTFRKMLPRSSSGPRKQTSTAAARNKGKPKATNDSETSDHLESLCTTLITRASAFAPLGAPKASGGGHFADSRRNAGWSGAAAHKSAHPRSELENHGGETGARARRSVFTRARPSRKCFDLHLAAARSVVGAASLCVHSSFGLPEWLV